MASDWREEMDKVKAHDPMSTEPAPNVMADADYAAETRVMNLQYQYDWLANMTVWDDDSQQFYERSLGVISNGFEVGARPSALYLATDLPTQSTNFGGSTAQRGGYVELDYGSGGNVERMTVRAQCHDVNTTTTCYDDASLALSARRAHLYSHCVCASEQHYQYRWDELNRLAEARRYDRAGTGNWAIAARQRYRYDSANQRTVKQTLDVNFNDDVDSDGAIDIDPQLPHERIALYVYGGDFERRGLARDDSGSDLVYIVNPDGSSETQFLVGGARMVRKDEGIGAGQLHPDDRITVGITDLIQITFWGRFCSSARAGIDPSRVDPH